MNMRLPMTNWRMSLSALILPKHIAIVMDGNGRWAKKRHLPRIAGHKAGLEAARQIVEYCVKKQIEVLTLFVFSSENWRRPEEEVSYLMQLFITILERDTKKLHEQNVKLNVVGDRSRFNPKLQKYIQNAESLTAKNTGLNLVLAANYGGQWDVTQAIQKIAIDVAEGTLNPSQVDVPYIEKNLAFAAYPHPDLFIRSGGEVRISNFLLWQLAYTELYFTETFWPDFNIEEFNKALTYFSTRDRRFGATNARQ